MEAIVLHQLGRVYQEQRQWDDAARHYAEAARVSEAHGNADGAVHIRNDLAAVQQEAGSTESTQDWHRKAIDTDRHREPALKPDAAATLGVMIDEEVATDYVFEPDLLIDGQRERRLTRWIRDPELLADAVRPMLAPCARSFTEDDGAVRFCLALLEPSIERHAGATVIRRFGREVVVAGHLAVLWRLIRRIDGTRTTAEILSEFPASQRALAAHLLGVLAATGVVDVSGRPIGRFLHAATKKGVVPAGGLAGDAVLQLATDGNYRTYPDARRFTVAQSVPDPLRSFHALTRARRSRRDYAARAMNREDLDALLNTACGVTGTLQWAGREVKLRAYPASGALYAVEIYPVVLRVEGLEAAVYHYHAVDSVLELVTPGLDPARFAGAMLPMERDMVAGAAAMICLVGFFPRHEAKYGQGGYRIMVAEAGHISQNLVLAATALGLSARPFGGVFDGLLNEDLGLNEAHEQFLLSVLVGHTCERAGGKAGGAGHVQ
jgi:SagB-type dehydrogenase family enzyme